MARYRALRGLHYVDENAKERTVREGNLVTNASPGKIAALLEDGFIEEVDSDDESTEED